MMYRLEYICHTFEVSQLSLWSLARRCCNINSFLTLLIMQVRSFHQAVYVALYLFRSKRDTLYVLEELFPLWYTVILMLIYYMSFYSYVPASINNTYLLSASLLRGTERRDSCSWWSLLLPVAAEGNLSDVSETCCDYAKRRTWTHDRMAKPATHCIVPERSGVFVGAPAPAWLCAAAGAIAD